jgi:polysaccharide biosynthesis protein PslG
MRQTPPRPRPIRTLALALSVATILWSLSSAFAPTVHAATVPRFGMAAHLMWQTLSETKRDLDRMKAAGMNYVRFDLSWKNSEPVKGQYRYLDKLNDVIHEVRARGFKLTITIIETPAWANGGKGTFAPPTYVADYARFVGVVAKKNAWRSGMTYEIWNEPNDIHFWTTGVNVAKYTAMLKASYKAIKAADSGATVLGGSILANDIKFLHGIYANGGGNSFTGLAIHPYTNGRAPGDTSKPWFSFKTSVSQFKKEMANHGQSKKIWITEMGWSTAQVSDSTRATYYKQAVAIAKNWTSVKAMAAYTLHQSQFPAYGLLRVDNSTTASWRAYDSVIP